MFLPANAFHSTVPEVVNFTVMADIPTCCWCGATYGAGHHSDSRFHALPRCSLSSSEIKAAFKNEWLLCRWLIQPSALGGVVRLTELGSRPIIYIFDVVAAVWARASRDDLWRLVRGYLQFSILHVWCNPEETEAARVSLAEIYNSSQFEGWGTKALLRMCQQTSLHIIDIEPSLDMHGMIYPCGNGDVNLRTLQLIATDPTALFPVTNYPHFSRVLTPFVPDAVDGGLFTWFQLLCLEDDAVLEAFQLFMGRFLIGRWRGEAPIVCFYLQQSHILTDLTSLIDTVLGEQLAYVQVTTPHLSSSNHRSVFVGPTISTALVAGLFRGHTARQHERTICSCFLLSDRPTLCLRTQLADAGGDLQHPRLCILPLRALFEHASVDSDSFTNPDQRHAPSQSISQLAHDPLEREWFLLWMMKGAQRLFETPSLFEKAQKQMNKRVWDNAQPDVTAFQ